MFLFINYSHILPECISLYFADSYSKGPSKLNRCSITFQIAYAEYKFQLNSAKGTAVFCPLYLVF